MYPQSSATSHATDVEQKHWSFGSVLGAVTPDLFRDQYWGKQWLHVRRSHRDFYDGLITLADIERHLSMHEALVRHSVATPREGYGMPDPPPASLSELCERVMTGHSLRIRRMECFLDPAAPLMSLVRDMIAALQHPLESLSCYVARGGAAGLGPHHDETEIFTLQITGRKRWRLYHRITSATSTATYAPATLGEPAHEVTLEPGDLLYTPRGLIHEVTAEDAAFSITIVFDPFTWRALLDLLSERLSATEAFQAAIPAGAITGRGADSLACDVQHRLDRIRQALETIGTEEVVDTLAERLISRIDWPAGTTQLSAVLSIDDIALDTVVERNAGIPHYLSRRGDRVRLILPGGYTIQVNARAEPALREVLAASVPFAVAEMHESLGDAAKLALAKKLVGSGVLRPLTAERA